MKTMTITPDATRPGATVTAWLPEAADVAGLVVGGQAPSCFGRLGLVTRVYAKGVDREGRAFVCYYVALSERDTVENGCGCSNAMTEGELMLTVALTALFTAADCDDVEACLRSGVELPGRLSRGSVRAEGRAA